MFVLLFVRIAVPIAVDELKQKKDEAHEEEKKYNSQSSLFADTFFVKQGELWLKITELRLISFTICFVQPHDDTRTFFPLWVWV